MSRFFLSVVVVGVGVLVSSLASAQNGGAQPPQPQPAQPNRYGEHDPYGTINTTTGAGGASDFPAAFVAVVPEARARAAAASAMHDRASSDMGLTITRLQHEFEHSAEMRAAVNEERDAYQQLQDVRAKALAPVVREEEVQAAENLRTGITDRIQEQHGSSQVDQKQVVALATLKMEVAQKIREKEALALASDPAVVQAQARYMIAARSLSEMRERNSDQIRNHPDILAARKALDDARVVKLATIAYLDGAVRVANVALDYAYNLHRWDYYRYGVSAGGYYYGSYPYYSNTGYYDAFYATRRY